MVAEMIHRGQQSDGERQTCNWEGRRHRRPWSIQKRSVPPPWLSLSPSSRRPLPHCWPPGSPPPCGGRGLTCRTSLRTQHSVSPWRTQPARRIRVRRYMQPRAKGWSSSFEKQRPTVDPPPRPPTLTEIFVARESPGSYYFMTIC